MQAGKSVIGFSEAVTDVSIPLNSPRVSGQGKSVPDFAAAHQFAGRTGGSVCLISAEAAGFYREFGALGEILVSVANCSAGLERRMDAQEWSAKRAFNALDSRSGRDFPRSGGEVLALAVLRGGPGYAGRSLQFIDPGTYCSHKVFLTENSDIQQFDRFVERFRKDAPGAVGRMRHGAVPGVPGAGAKVSVRSLRKHWASLQSREDLCELLQQWKLRRVDALQRVGERLARRIPVEALFSCVEMLSVLQLPGKFCVND